ncbi:MAG: hypothetical protein AAGF24_01315 [Cyanobacteria bacterium P01_H01_bin.121]
MPSELSQVEMSPEPIDRGGYDDFIDDLRVAEGFRLDLVQCPVPLARHWAEQIRIDALTGDFCTLVLDEFCQCTALGVDQK